MHVPGERTIRKLVGKALRPATELSRRIGVPELSWKLRRAAIEAHVRRRENPRLSPEEAEYVRLHHALSEPSGYFFSENIVSNEIGFLAPAPALARLPRGLAYVGVGPEQTLSYLALTGSSLAFVIDVRRDNARLHILYRALFEEAGSRAEWLALLLGRAYDTSRDPGPTASLERVLSHATSLAPSPTSFRAAHMRLRARIDRLGGLLLPGDARRIAALHRWFWKQQLDITFQLDGPRLRTYPTLESLLAATAPDGHPRSFLASEAAFRAVQALERDSRVIPAVGDLGGHFALRDIGAEIRRRGLSLGAIYVSNVEQYLFEKGTFPRWVESLGSFPIHPEAVIVRSYPESDAGAPAPDAPRSLLGQLQRSAGIAARAYLTPEHKQVHRMPTVAHKLPVFLDRARRIGYQSFRDVVCDPALAAG